MSRWRHYSSGHSSVAILLAVVLGITGYWLWWSTQPEAAPAQATLDLTRLAQEASRPLSPTESACSATEGSASQVLGCQPGAAAQLFPPQPAEADGASAFATGLRALAVGDPDAWLMLRQQLDLCLGPDSAAETRGACGAAGIARLGRDVAATIARFDGAERRRLATLHWLEIEWQFAERRRHEFLRALRDSDPAAADATAAESSQPLWKMNVDVQEAREKLERFIATTSAQDPATHELLMRLRGGTSVPWGPGFSVGGGGPLIRQ